MIGQEDVGVWTTSGSTDRRVGTLRPSFSGSRVLASSSFEYDEAFLRDGWQISPDLPLRAGRKYTAENTTLPGSFSDAAGSRLGDAAARKSRQQVAASVSTWDKIADELGIAAEERGPYRVAFDTEQIDWALPL
ncbi:MAG: hypothetical protein JWP75_4100 [Frondihabitans sp.]|nr:hypothetical protein [Frondihabitans sp.]